MCSSTLSILTSQDYLNRMLKNMKTTIDIAVGFCKSETSPLILRGKQAFQVNEKTVPRKMIFVLKDEVRPLQYYTMRNFVIYMGRLVMLQE